MTDDNKDRGDKISVGLYVHGRLLEPGVITTTMGTEPTDAHRMAEVRGPAHRPYAPKKWGLWASVRDSNGGKPEDVLEELLSEVGLAAARLPATPGVEGAYFDVFVARIVESDGRSDFALELSAETLRALAAAGFPLRLTFAGVPR